MFAVMKTGGKQYRVKVGDTLRVEKLAADAGDKVQFNDVLMVGSTVGAPFVDGAGVQAEVIDQIKGDKVIHFVKRRRKHSSKRTKGHRQKLTLLKITDVLESGAGKSGVKAAVGAGSVAATAAVPQAAPAAKSVPTQDATDTGTKPANLLPQARDTGPDNLKQINGLGPKMEKMLHENGVFHFDQIAAWGADEIAYMDATLSLKGRMERDNWIAQATAFAAEKE